MTPIRVALAGFFHETNTYGFPHNPLTELRDFRVLRGDRIIEAMKGGGDSSSGFIAEAEAQPEVFELVPVYLATANPSGLISAKCWATLRKELLEELKRTMDRGRIDCIALHLHGAGVSEDSTDLEGLLLEDIRRLVGPNVVIVANLDLHAKMTRRMHENVDMINSVLTYPHIDHNPRSRELLRLVPAVLQKKMKPVRWVERIPFVLVSAPTVPNLGFLMSDVREMCESAMRRPGILDASVGHGFPFSDIPDAGVHVWVTSDGQPELAKRVALEIADFIWKNKERALPKLTMPEDGVKKAMDVLRSQGRLDIYAGGKGGRKHPGTYGFVPDEDSKGGPVMLVDSADNPGGGSAGDNTYLLKAMWESKVERAAFVGLIDAELVAKLCDGAKIGTMLSNVSMGGRSAQWSGPPFILPQAYLKSISAGRMTFRGYSRPTMTDLGRTVCLVDPETGFHIVVVERNCQVFDDNWMINHGIVPDQFRLIGIKSAVHFRAWFGDKTSSIIVVDGQPGLTSHNIDAFPKVKHVESLFPYHEGVEYERGRGLDVKERTGGFGAKVRL